MEVFNEFQRYFTRLCSERGESPSTVCMRLGYSNAVYSQWTDDTIPRNSTLSKIADYFGVSTDYLLGKEDNQSSHSLLRPICDVFVSSVPSPILSQSQSSYLLRQCRNIKRSCSSPSLILDLNRDHHHLRP